MKLLYSIMIICTINLMATPHAEGASAQARVSAEVIDPSMIDFSKVLSTAATGTEAPPSDKAPGQQGQPEVKIVVVDGVTFLTIDYN